MSPWSAALCEHCWRDDNPTREPVRLRDADLETCSNCGLLTNSGIYVRRDPLEQRYPREFR